MDDFVLPNLHESRNEWCWRLVSILTPQIQEGIKSLFNEAVNMCVKNNEIDKYLMTFQNLLSRIPKWNNEIVEDERKRIIENSGCNYLEDLISCVHIIQLKILTCARVGNKQKKIDISIPKLDMFVHKIYINVARKVYKNTYLYEKGVTPLQNQKNGRELETIVQECIMMAIRESIPTEEIIRAYMDENIEHEEEVIIEDVPNETKSDNIDNDNNIEIKESEDNVITKEDEIPDQVPSVKDVSDEEVKTQLTFNDIDNVLNENDESEEVSAPKTVERLEEISTSRALQRKLDELNEEEEDDMLKIGENVELTGFDVLDDSSGLKVSEQDIVLNDIEEI